MHDRPCAEVTRHRLKNKARHAARKDSVLIVARCDLSELMGGGITVSREVGAAERLV